MLNSCNFSVWKQAWRSNKLCGRSQLLQEERPQRSCSQSPKGLLQKEEFLSELKLMQIFLAGNWHLHGHGAVHHCSKTPWDNCRNLWVRGEFYLCIHLCCIFLHQVTCFLTPTISIIPPTYQLFQCADLDKAMQHYEQVTTSYYNADNKWSEIFLWLKIFFLIWKLN